MSVDGALSDKELKSVERKAGAALRHTTKRSANKTLRSRGVTVTSQQGLSDTTGLRRNGVITVFIVHEIADAEHREQVVRSIMKADGVDNKRVADDSSRVASHLGDSKHFYDRANDIAYVNRDLNPGASDENLTALTGDLIHEGIGHRALPAGYHSATGVMAREVKTRAREKDIQFQGQEHAAVNTFLQKLLRRR